MAVDGRRLTNVVIDCALNEHSFDKNAAARRGRGGGRQAAVRCRPQILVRRGAHARVRTNLCTQNTPSSRVALIVTVLSVPPTRFVSVFIIGIQSVSINEIPFNSNSIQREHRATRARRRPV